MEEIAVAYDVTADRYHVDIPLDGSHDVGKAIVFGIGEILDQDPVTLPPLGQAVDTDSLSAILESTAGADSDVAVSFDYSGFVVTVDDGGRITFEEFQ